MYMQIERPMKTLAGLMEQAKKNLQRRRRLLGESTKRFPPAAANFSMKQREDSSTIHLRV
jgi:hypothetical protein